MPQIVITPQKPLEITPAMRAAGIGLGNYADIRVGDPAVQAAIRYLEAIGAPAPWAQSDELEIYPGSGFFYSSVIWMNPTNGEQARCQAGILAAFPNILTTELFDIGLLPIGAEVDGDALAPYQVAAMMPPPVSAPTILLPTSPIGSPIFPGVTGIGAEFNPSITDSMGSHPFGGTWTEDGAGLAPLGRYTKIGAMNLFGPSVKWRRDS